MSSQAEVALAASGDRRRAAVFTGTMCRSRIIVVLSDIWLVLAGILWRSRAIVVVAGTGVLFCMRVAAACQCGSGRVSFFSPRDCRKDIEVNVGIS